MWRLPSKLLLVVPLSLVTCEAERGGIVETPIKVLTSLGEDNMRSSHLTGPRFVRLSNVTT
jgi:hypothetical protein